MDLDDLTWALTEEQKRCIEGAKNESSVEKVVPKPLPACPVLMDDKFIQEPNARMVQLFVKLEAAISYPFLLITILEKLAIIGKKSNNMIYLQMNL